MSGGSDLGPVIATFRGPLRLIKGPAIVFGILFSLVAIYRFVKTNSASEMAEILLAFCALTVALGIFVKTHIVRVQQEGLSGRNFWSWPVQIKWENIDTWRLESNSGFSAVVLTERGSGREMWIFRDVFFSEEFHSLFEMHANHPLPEEY